MCSHIAILILNTVFSQESLIYYYIYMAKEAPDNNMEDSENTPPQAPDKDPSRHFMDDIPQKYSKPGEESSRVEELQEKLYSPNAKFGVRKRKKLREKAYNVERDWDDNPEETEGEVKIPKRKSSFFAKLFGIALIFFIFSVGYGLYILMGGGGPSSGDDVEIEIIGPISIGTSDPLSLDIIIKNNNTTALEAVDLVIEYPDGTKDAEDLSRSLPRTRIDLGDVDPLSVVREADTSALFGEEGSVQEIEVKVEYRLPGSTAIFEKIAIYEVVLQSAPVRVKVFAPREISAGQELEFEIDVSSNSTKDLSDILVIAEYPFGFEASGADPRPSAGSNVWRIDSLRPNETKTITLKGSIEAQNGDERVFKFTSGLAEGDTDELDVIFTTIVNSIEITRPFLGVDLAFDRQTGENFVADGEERIEGEIRFTNNLDDVIRDARIELEIVGDVLDEESIFATGGFYRSSDNTLIWNKSTFEQFEEILPKKSGTAIFIFKSLDLGSSARLFKNPELQFNIKLSGRRVNEEGVEEDMETTTFKTIKFNTDADIYGSSFYSKGPFTNAGPLPPKADEPTSYTVELSVTNTSNDLKDAKITGTLPDFVSWNGKVSESGVTYDSVSREVTWDIGDVKAGVGYDTEILSNAFQVTLLPSITQIGATPHLITNIQLVGTDNFTGQTITKTASAVTIQIEDTDSSGFEYGKVSR